MAHAGGILQQKVSTQYASPKVLACVSTSIQIARWVMYKAIAVLASPVLSIVIMLLQDH